MIEFSADINAKLHACAGLVVGFSGGLDSTVLLHQLANDSTLSARVRAVHVNHGISANAQSWQEHCEVVCRALNIPLLIRVVQLRERANLEEAARIARYTVFASVLQANEALLLAHHADDQAETLLLNLFRGAGLDGLAAMPAVKSFAAGVLIRPLLSTARSMLLFYAEEHKLTWVLDESNQDVNFARNYLRHHVLPSVTMQWPHVVKNLLRTAEHCQTAKKNLESLATIDLPDLDADILPLAGIISLERSRIDNILRAWISKHKVHSPSTNTFQCLIDEVIFARHDKTPCLQWDNVIIRRFNGALYWLIQSATVPIAPVQWVHFPSALVFTLGILCAESAVRGLYVPKNCQVTVRFRCGGETIRLHGQTKSLKKLMQSWQIPTWQRALVPLIYINDELAVVVGYAVSDLYYATTGTDVYTITIRH